MTKGAEVLKPVSEIPGVKETVRLSLRPVEEVERIEERLLTWACGDIDKARKLLWRVEFQMYGKTWGNDLVVGDETRPRAGVAEVIRMVDLAARMTDAHWQSWLATYAVEGVRLWPFDAPLYLAMVEELGGKPTLESVTAKMTAVGLTIPERMMKRARDAYDGMVGKSYWEIDEEWVFMSFSLCYSFWKENVDEVVEVWDGANEDVDFCVWLAPEEILVRSRERLRELARVMLGRELITPDQGVSFGWGELKYSDVLALLD